MTEDLFEDEPVSQAKLLVPVPPPGSGLPEVPADLPVGEQMLFREELLRKVSGNLIYNFLVAGKMLHEIKVSGYLDELNETMAQYLASRSIGFGEATASKLVKVYATFILQAQLAPDAVASVGDAEKTYIAALLVDQGLSPAEALSKAKALSRSDLNVELKELKHDGDDQGQPLAAWMKKWTLTMDLEQLEVFRDMVAAIQDDRERAKLLLGEAYKVAKSFTDKEVGHALGLLEAHFASVKKEKKEK